MERREWHVLSIFLLVVTIPGCGEDASLEVPETRTFAMPPAGADPWAGLSHPVRITTDRDGRVYVGDRGDRTIKVFDPEGTPLHEFGGFGSGPGELTDIQAVVSLEQSIVVNDPGTGRLVRFAPDGTFQGAIPNPSSADAVGAFGPDRIVLASSPLWAMNAAMDPAAAVLFEVVSPEGEIELSGGDRRPTENPFVGHIWNFVLPAGSGDGAFLWLARLNHPAVIRHDAATGESSPIERSLPFDWRELHPEFEPSQETMARLRDEGPPFDALSLDIATDRSDRAYVLTALSPSGPLGDMPTDAGIDVLDPNDGWIHRIRLPEAASALAVSPDGSRLYLLDEATAQIRVYGWSRDG